jgi:hypothetical protein
MKTNKIISRFALLISAIAIVALSLSFTIVNTKGADNSQTSKAEGPIGGFSEDPR